MRILFTYFLSALAVTTLMVYAGQVSTLQTIGAQDETSFLVGTWTLARTANPNDPRQIQFNAQLEGTYRNSQNQEKPIKNAKYKSGYLYFTVPDLQLYFEMRKVKDRFEGKMTVFNPTEKRMPEPVIMRKNK
jgi:hypothetical protein